MNHSDFSHSSWYKDRYESSANLRRRAEIQQHYVDLAKQKKERTETRGENNKLAIESIGLEYKVINKSLWLVTIGNEKVYFYPTTNRWRPKGEKITYYSRGIADMVGKVLNYQASVRENSRSQGTRGQGI